LGFFSLYWFGRQGKKRRNNALFSNALKKPAIFALLSLLLAIILYLPAIAQEMTKDEALLALEIETCG